MNQNRRKILYLAGVSGGVISAGAGTWAKPVINAVVLPAHAQTTCLVDTIVGGPLAGNPHNASSCRTACQAEAIVQDAKLCGFEEIPADNGPE